MRPAGNGVVGFERTGQGRLPCVVIQVRGLQPGLTAF